MTVFSDVACTRCGCVCDDLRVTVEGGAVVEAERACRLAEPWFLAQKQFDAPEATVEGRTVSRAEAINAAAALLQNARDPLIYGLSHSGTSGQRAALRLADQLGAVVDTNASSGKSASILAMQTVGVSTCTLGEVRQRAELVIYWGADPVESHPRHTERYTLEPAGLFVPRGRAGRHVVVVDVRRTATAELADTFIQVSAGGDFEILWSLYALARGVEVQPTPLLEPLWPTLLQLAERLKSVRCGAVFFGSGLSRGELGHRNVEALFRLTSELNRFNRFYVGGMSGLGGAENVLTWQTGYPCSVNLNRGYPRYQPDEFSASELLERGEVDCVVLVGSQAVQSLSEPAQRRLCELPTIALDPPEQEALCPATIRFTTSVPGLHFADTAYRMDGVPIPLQSLLPSPYPSDAEVLLELLSAYNNG